MKINKNIQIIALLAIITIALIAIGISANESINEKPGPQYQGNSYCPDRDDCPQPYCNNYDQQETSNYQPRSCCGSRT